MTPLPPNFVWILPWAPLEEVASLPPNILHDQTYSQWLAAELQREVCEGHGLFGASVEAVGFNKCDPNEFLFVTDQPKMPFAFVHLTWTAETNPTWPWMMGFASTAELRAWMKECHDSYLKEE
jgi:hypothetical protein